MQETGLGGGGETRQIVRAMRRARQVQLGMLPRTPVVDGLEIHAHYQACEEVGGDFYDFVSVSPWELGIAIGDVSGHGVDAALLMATAKKSLQLNARGRSSPRETLLVVCEDLAPDLPGKSFITVFYGVLDLRKGVLRYASTGHNPPLLFNGSRSEKLRELKAKGTVMSAITAPSFERTLEEGSLRLESGDTLFLFTDGVPEAMDENGEQFGDEPVRTAIQKNAAPRALIESVNKRIELFREQAAQSDDITMLALRYNAVSKTGIASSPAIKRRVLSNLPTQTNSFIGQQKALAALRKQLARPSGFVTITGTGGCGKSRLALAIGRDDAAQYPGGVWLAELSDCKTAGEVAQAAAHALSVPLDSNLPPEESVARALAQRPNLLLILDGYEQAAEQAGDLVRKWRAAAPNCRILVTSRALLGIDGEQEIRLGALDCPTSAQARDMDAARISQFEAVQLFLDRVREVRADFALDEKGARLVAEICAELEGLPLAIELAASRSRVMSLEQIARQLKTHTDRMRMLTSGKRDTALKQRSLEEAIRWSFNLLQDWEKAAFEQLCVFQGGFWLEAAEAVLDLSAFEDAPDNLAAVQSLLEKSLLHIDDTAYGARFRMFAPIRDFGRHLWNHSLDTGVREPLLKRFSHYFASYAANWAEHYYSRHCVEVLDRLETDRDNIWRAADWFWQQGQAETAARITFTMNQLHRIRGPFAHQAVRVEKAIESLGNEHPGLRALLTVSRAATHLLVGEYNDAGKLLDHAVKTARGEGCELELAHALRIRGLHRLGQNQADNALADLNRAEELFRAHGPLHRVAETLGDKAKVIRSLKRYDEALALCNEAERLHREAGNFPGLAILYGNRARLLHEMQRFDDALREFIEGEAVLVKIGDSRNVCTFVNNRGILMRDMGRMEEAMECYLQAERIAREKGLRGDLAVYIDNRARVHLFFDDLDAAQAAALESEEIFKSLNVSNSALARALNTLGQVAMKRKQFQPALDYFKRAGLIESEDVSTPDKAQHSADAALALLGLGRVEEARAEVKAAIKLVSEHATSDARLFALAVATKIEHQAGNSGEAKRLGTQAREIVKTRGFTEYTSRSNVRQALELLKELGEAYGA